MKVTVETNSPPADVPCTDRMPHLMPCILTAAPIGVASSVGDPVVRVIEYLYFPKQSTWSNLSASYRCRPLAPGEKIIIRDNNVKVVNTPEDQPLEDMVYVSAGIVTAIPEETETSVEIGDVVFRGHDEFLFVNADCWRSEDSVGGFRFRPLQPGERITIEG